MKSHWDYFDQAGYLVDLRSLAQQEGISYNAAVKRVERYGDTSATVAGVRVRRQEVPRPVWLARRFETQRAANPYLRNDTEAFQILSQLTAGTLECRGCGYESRHASRCPKCGGSKWQRTQRQLHTPEMTQAEASHA
jgi:rubrerythrin